MTHKFLYFATFHILLQFVCCPYPPTGDDVLPGSVLLPASRRGRYLANIIRRQAVDGTGIKFNKDADRMNAEAKKKVDVLSDELLPYIIAEQERRTTLYKRVMTAIQNGEKGITIAEIRNKPPLIIRKGLFYRCPSNRAPKEPDGSGYMKCEDEQEPQPVMYDSCLSAEDKELYVAENKYFFCNRMRSQGPDLPRNGTVVIGCGHEVRTSLNYTVSKCTLEDTDDVVVHYRYYPDRTYKFVTELDPDHEVCDHWNPCQIGYIYSLPSPDQAVLATELWAGYVETPAKYEADEMIPAIPEDTIEIAVSPDVSNYQSEERQILIPEGYKYEKLWAKRLIDGFGWNPLENQWGSTADVTVQPTHVSVIFKFPETWAETFYSTYYMVFTKNGRRSSAKSVRILILVRSAAHVRPIILAELGINRANETLVPYRCSRCIIQGLVVRSPEGFVHNLSPFKYSLKEIEGQTFISFSLSLFELQDFGDVFINLQNADGAEERVKLLAAEEPSKVSSIKFNRITESPAPGGHVDKTEKFECEDCQLVDVQCYGESMTASGRVSIVPATNTIGINIVSFDDSYSGVYVGLFKNTTTNKMFQKILMVIDNSAPGITLSHERVPAPQVGTSFVQKVPFTCEDSEGCPVEKLSLNGYLLPTDPPAATRRQTNAKYSATSKQITITIPVFTMMYAGVYQAVFRVGGQPVTKTVLEIIAPGDESAGDKGDNDDDHGDNKTDGNGTHGNGTGNGSDNNGTANNST